MAMDHIKAWIGQHSELVDFVGPVTSEQILLAEEELAISFPDTYRLFVEEYGCGNVGPIEIFGLGIKPIGVPNVIWVTNTLRSDSGLPHHLLPIENLGDGAYACLTTEQSVAKGYQSSIVLEWSHGTETQKISENLNIYLLERFRVATSL
ncbi:SMI1/KNR4 family protein [Paenibacillus frigoriresistens]|uniref:SMI1/KNR4 family protein n=1 Tax=Paenibacillus alginolyticus TaxID=59839 RepID=UPI0015672644|nr:SMI1/KNR4 family protein [Paenibacillus frigoriresistens]NRF93596.1 SMI1/KNR4 family protein [Paenibacillus frigoriresistens]